MKLNLLIFLLLSYSVLLADTEWHAISKNTHRTGQFELKAKSARLDFTGLMDVSFDDPDKIFHSSGRSIDGNYEFGFSEISTLNLFSGTISTGVVINHDVAYFATDSKLGIALDLTTKSVKWNVNLKAEVEAEPIATERLVYFCDTIGNVTAVDKESGGVTWQLKMKAGIYAHPLLKSNWLIVADSSGLVQLIDTHVNQKHWSYQLPSGVVGTPMVVGDKLWVGSLDGVLYRFDLETGNREYQQKLSSAVTKGMCLVESNTRPSVISVGTEEGMLHAFDLEGNELPHSPMDLELKNLTPIASRGLIYVCHDVSFFQIDPWLGEPLFEFTPSGQNFFGDLVFDGKSIHALVLKKSPATTAKIVDVQFSFLDDWQGETTDLPWLSSVNIQWDGNLSEPFWEKAANFPLAWTSDGGQHFEKIQVKMALAQDGIAIAGLFEPGGVSKLNYENIEKSRFELNLKQLSLGLDAKLIIHGSGELGLNEKSGIYKNNLIFSKKKGETLNSWAFETFIPVSIEKLKKHQVFELNSSYFEEVRAAKSAKTELQYCLNPRKDISSLLLPSKSLK